MTIHDRASVGVSDLSSQFYLTEADIGKNRAAACRAKLQELNTAVLVSSSEEELTHNFLQQFQVPPVTSS